MGEKERYFVWVKGVKGKKWDNSRSINNKTKKDWVYASSQKKYVFHKLYTNKIIPGCTPAKQKKELKKEGRGKCAVASELDGAKGKPF